MSTVIRKMRTTLGWDQDTPADVDVKELRELRIASARRMHRWTELAETDLVGRGPYLVHAQTDELFVPYAGPIFARRTSAILFQDHAPMYWYVNRVGDVAVIERRPGRWGDIVAQKARRGRT